MLIHAGAQSPSAMGQTIDVGNSTDLENAIQTINSQQNGNFTLNVTNDFTLSQQVQSLNSTSTVTLNGNSHTIDGASTYLPLTVDSGSVTLQSLNIAHSSAPVTVNGGTLIDSTGSLQGPVINDGLVKFNSSTSDTYSGVISGTGQVEISGTGKVTFTGQNTYTGGTTIDQNAQLQGTTSSLHGPITDNWYLQFNQATVGTFDGAITGTGRVDVTGGAVLTFTGLNSYSGGTYIDRQSVLIGNTSSIQGAIVNDGTLNIKQSTDGTFAGNLAGTGTIEISGGGAITFTGLNNDTGGMIVDTGSKLIGTTSSLAGNIIDNGALKFNQSTSGTFAGGITGTGTVEISGGGHVTLTGTNSYTGGTTVDSGTSLLGTTNSLQGAINNNGAIDFNQTTIGIYSGNMSGTGSVEVGGTGVVRFTGTNSYTGGTTIDSGGTLNTTVTGLQGVVTNNGSVQFSSPTGTFIGSMGGTGNVEIAANTGITMAGHNTYSGGTTVDDNATLIGSTLGVQGNILNNGFVKFQNLALPSGLHADTLLTPNLIWLGGPIPTSFPAYGNVYSGSMTGTGRVEISGSTTIFTNVNSYTGGTTVDTGSTLMGNTASVQGNVTNNGLVVFNSNIGLFAPGAAPPIIENDSIIIGGFRLPSIVGSYTGNMSGAGGVEIAGNQAIQFSGVNTYTGGTTVNANNAVVGTTSSLQGAFTNMGQVVFSQWTNGTYSGNMAGSGFVQINGSGKVTFSGTNTYSGGTHISVESTLIGTTHSLQGNIIDNGMLQFNQSASGTFSSVIEGMGAVEINVPGPITFSGANTYTGGTQVDAGSTLILGPQGSILGTTTINNGGTLEGQGTLGNLIVNAGGMVNPGTVNSSLTINGNFNQNTGSTYSTEVSPTGSDKIAVTGTAQIGTGTTLNLVIDQGTYTVGTKYTILSAAGGLTGTYTNGTAPTISQNVIFFEHYDAHDLQLVVGSNLLNNARTMNQAMVAAVFDQTSTTATGNYANAISQLTTLSAGPLSNAMNQLTGDIYPSLSTVARQTTTAQMQILSTRLATLTGPTGPKLSAVSSPNGIRLVSRQASDTPATSGSPAGSPATSSVDGQTWTSWAQGYGLGGNIGGDGNAGGTNYQLSGTLFGVERWLGDNLMVGVLGGYAGTSVKENQSGASAQINSYQAGLYELYREETMYISNIDAFTNNAYDVSRPINFGTVHQTASGSSSGNQWSHYTETGTTFEFDELRLQPFLGLQYMYLNQQGYTESGAGSLDMTTGSQSVNSLRNGIGARLTQEMMWGNVMVIPSLAARYQHEWGNGTQLVTSSFSGAPTVQFQTSGNHTGRNFGLVTLGATALVSDHFSIYGTLDTQFSSNFFALIGSGGLQYSW